MNNDYWFLDHAWLIPLIPAISYWVILLFGKRYKERAAWIGLASIGSAWVLAVGTVVQWIGRVNDAEEAHGRSTVESLRAFGRGIKTAAEGKTELLAPVIHQTFTTFGCCDNILRNFFSHDCFLLLSW